MEPHRVLFRGVWWGLFFWGELLPDWRCSFEIGLNGRITSHFCMIKTPRWSTVSERNEPPVSTLVSCWRRNEYHAYASKSSSADDSWSSCLSLKVVCINQLASCLGQLFLGGKVLESPRTGGNHPLEYKIGDQGVEEPQIQLQRFNPFSRHLFIRVEFGLFQNATLQIDS